jgi:retron-type reverse transcriptase
VKFKSILTNSREHVGKQIVVNVDLENFFPTITFPRVRAVFQRAGYSPAVATILALLCTEAPRKQVQYAGQTYYVAIAPRSLPQGACTSPAISNQVARRLDKRLQGIATKLNLSYTRYADDLTFSGNEELKERTGYLLARIRHITQDEGFAVNEKKSRILRRNSAQEVTGLVVNDQPKVPRKTVRRLRAILHSAHKTGLAAQNREGRTHFNGWLRGMISFVAMSQPEVGAKLKGELELLLEKEVK